MARNSGGHYQRPLLLGRRADRLLAAYCWRNRVDELKRTDPEIHRLIKDEERYQIESVRLIPSENYVSQAVLDATGSVLTNKYSEGYAHKRYYQGQRYIDEIETLAIERAKALFGAEHVNVQPYSGSPANLAIYFALLQPGDTLMGLALPHGGHLTHGWNVSITGSFWRPVHYTVDRETQRIEYDAIRDLARKERPKIIVTGATAYPRLFDFKVFGEIAQEVGAYLLADISHISGLIVAGAHPDPMPHADVVMTTTHKTLRGPRGAIVMCKTQHSRRIDKAVFPGGQGATHNHTIAAIAVDVLIGLLRDNYRGLPAQPQTILVNSVWRDGATAPSCERQAQFGLR